MLRAKAWAKRITDWHDHFSPNSELEHAMDYHNNRLGREFAMHHDVRTGTLAQRIMVLIPLWRKRKNTQFIHSYPTTLTPTIPI